MRRCEALKGDGSRCQAGAMAGHPWCYNHRPDLAEQRRQNASRGGKTGGRGRGGLSETEDAKKYVRGLIARLLRDEVERGTAAVVFQGINTLARLIELERRIREQDEIEERLAALEELQPEGNTGGGYRAWHR